MDTQQTDLQDLVGGIQLTVGVVVLVVMSAALHVSGRLRRALDFPPAPRNTLMGWHLLFVLIAFFVATEIFSFGLTMLGYPPLAPATQPAETVAPATQQAPATGPALDDDEASQPGPEAASPEESRETPASFIVLGLAELLAIGLMLHVANITFDGGIRGLGLRADHLGRSFAWATVGYLAFWPVCIVFAESATRLYEWLVSEPPHEHQVLLFLQDPDISLIWQIIAWTLAGVVAPIFEELFFRGLLLNWLRNSTRSTMLAILLSGLAFGIIHMPQYHLIPALAALGIVLGYVYTRTNSLTLAIFFHAIFNLRTLIILELARTSA